MTRKLATRHPLVLMLHEDDIPSGAASIVTEFVEDFRVFQMCSTGIEAIKSYQPKILLLEAYTVENAVKFYVDLSQKYKLLDYPHYVVLLCSNKEVQIAYTLCAKGIFHGYFVSRPIYEKYRLISILDHICKDINQSDELITITDKYEKQLNSGLNDLVGQITDARNELVPPISSHCQNRMQSIDIDQSAIDKVKKTIMPLIDGIEENITAKLLGTLEEITHIQSKAIERSNELKQQLNNTNPVKVENILEITQQEMQLIAELEQDVADQQAQNKESNDPLFSDAVKPDKLTSISHILLVEDNDIYRDMVKRILQKAEYKVDVAADGMEAIYKIKRKKYDLVLMDLFMPKLDGLNTTKQFRKITGKKDLPIIALTGNKNIELVKKWKSAGINGYIMKPSSKDKILEVVRSCLVKHFQ